jgi:PAS domain S-box-containing protein
LWGDYFARRFGHNATAAGVTEFVCILLFAYHPESSRDESPMKWWRQIKSQAGKAAIPRPLFPTLVTGILLAGIAFIDLVLTPRLHVGVFLYPVAIITALWWGRDRAVLAVTGLAVGLTALEQWAHPIASYGLADSSSFIATSNFLFNLLLLGLFGSACLYIARQEVKYKHAQESLTDIEARLTSVVQSTPDALILANAEGHIVFWNAGATSTFGYSEEEALGQPLTLIMPTRYREAHARGLRRICETGESRLIGTTVELYGLRKNGKEFPLELSLATWQTKGARFFSAFLRDITDRKRMETRQAVQLAISHVLMEADTIEQAGSRILQAIGHLTDWEAGLIWVPDQRTKALRCATVWQNSAPQALEEFLQKSRATMFESGVGLPGRVFATGEPDWITNVDKDENFPRLELARLAGLHAAFGFPVKGAQGVLGVIEFFSREIRPPDTGLLHTFADIGIKVGHFVERKQFAEETAKLVAELQSAAPGSNPLRGLLPICASCKKIRDVQGEWHELEQYLESHSEAQCSHTICTACARKEHPDWDKV